MATVSSRGQLVIPARMREKYRLKAGSRVKIEDRDGQITLTPDPPNPYDEMLALCGVMAHVEEDVEASEQAMRLGATLVTADPEFGKLGKALKLLALPRHAG